MHVLAHRPVPDSAGHLVPRLCSARGAKRVIENDPAVRRANQMHTGPKNACAVRVGSRIGACLIGPLTTARLRCRSVDRGAVDPIRRSRETVSTCVDAGTRGAGTICGASPLGVSAL